MGGEDKEGKSEVGNRELHSTVTKQSKNMKSTRELND